MNTDLELIKRDGKVALRQIGNNQRGIPVQVDGVDYAASIQHNVWLVWVDESHVQKLLNIQVEGCSCNNGSRKPLYKAASELDVALFNTGERPQ